MAFTRGQVDRFGQAIPASPGYSTIINADGTQPPMQNNLLLDASLVASDSANSGATLLAVANPITPAQLAILATQPVLIDKVAFNGSTYTSPAIPPATYSRLLLKMFGDSGAGPTVTLTGLTGTYSYYGFVSNGVAVSAPSSSSSWFLAASYPQNISAEFFILNGHTRSMNAQWETAVPDSRIYLGRNDDTTHEVTNLVLTFGSATVGRIEVYGVPV